MAASTASAVDVVFGAQSSGDVGMLGFQRGSTLKFLKNFRTFYCEISVQRHGVIISVQPIRIQLRRGGKSIFSPCFSQTFLFVLKARVIVCFTLTRRKACQALKLCQRVSAVRNTRHQNMTRIGLGCCLWWCQDVSTTSG